MGDDDVGDAVGDAVGMSVSVDARASMLVYASAPTRTTTGVDLIPLATSFTTTVLTLSGSKTRAHEVMGPSVTRHSASPKRRACTADRLYVPSASNRTKIASRTPSSKRNLFCGTPSNSDVALNENITVSVTRAPIVVGTRVGE